MNIDFLLVRMHLPVAGNAASISAYNLSFNEIILAVEFEPVMLCGIRSLRV